MIDGDTVEVLLGTRRRRYRLAGIDAPERQQSFGRAAEDRLRAEILNKTVHIQPYKIDRYGRLIGQLFDDEGDVSLRQIDAGLAWSYRCFEHEQLEIDRHRYREAEATARRARRGLWSDAYPVAPWEYRGRPCQKTEGGELYDGHVMANPATGKYFLPGCRGYQNIAPANRLRFANERAAVNAGFSRSDGC